MHAVDRWRESLGEWGIPQDILDAAPESPWAFSPELMRRRAEVALEAEPTTSSRRALEALPPGGVVLDVGVGSGAASLPLASRAGRIVGVDDSDELLDVFAWVGRSTGVEITTVKGRWPDAAGAVPIADVAVCQHVLYNVADLEPFARAIDEHADRRVVLTLTTEHPLFWMNDLWLHFHGLVRPTEPTAGLAEDALTELGYPVRRDDEVRPPRAVGWERREDVVARLRRQLCLTPDRDAELVRVLGDRMTEREGLWYVEPSAHPIATLWWDTA